MSDEFWKETPKLGFGLMRLPKKGLLTDLKQMEQMVDRFLEAGFTYFDTAFVYGTSESDTRKALVSRHPRESFTLATKLNARMAPTEKTAKNQFYTSLKRTGAEYFDYYLLHSLMENNYQRYEKFHLWDFVAEQKEKGLIKRAGFSFHAGPELLDKLLTEHPEADFVQLQINYADWENPAVTSRANYEVARRHGKPVVIMEPVKGGRLADPPEEVRRLMKECRPEMSCASWAIRFAASLDGVLTVLSGMSNLAQMEDNLSYMGSFQPLDTEERQVIRRAQEILGASAAIPCTACHYCVSGCPKGIAIPDIFDAANCRLSGGQMALAAERYSAAAPEGHRASDCIGCRQCESVCPQHLKITEHLKKCAEMLE